MMTKKLATILTSSVIIITLIIIAVPQATACVPIKVTFDTSGYSTSTSNIIFTIDGCVYHDSNLPLNFSWNAGDTHTVKVASYITGSDSQTYNFTSWTNGNGLTATSTTFTVPSSDTTVIANYARTTYNIKFTTSGLSNIADYVLTIDGTRYLYSSLCSNQASFIWAVGSKHTIQAATTLSSSDSPPKGYTFQNWTNGDGLTSASGTFTMPASDVIVIANYALNQSITPASTALTVTCTNSSNPDAVTISGVLTSGSTGLTGKTITLSYYNATTWVAIGQVTTTTGGAYTYTWIVPTDLATGVYPLKANFAGDSSYQASSASGELTLYGMHVVVLPESLGSIVALIACFGGAVVFFKLRSNNGVKA